MNEKFYINSLQPQFANGGQIKCLMLVAGGACGAGASHLIPTSHFTSEQIMLSSSPTPVQSKSKVSNAERFMISCTFWATNYGDTRQTPGCKYFTAKLFLHCSL